MLVAPIVALGVFVAANLLVVDLPNYGTWTGIRPLETKLDLLETFAKQGPVDAIVLGSSVVDFGFSAEEYSRLMSEKLGRPYRVFNFATGGAGISTFPDLYRIARTVSKPKEIWIASSTQRKNPEGIEKHTPDYLLNSAPISSTLESPHHLLFSRWAWKIPLIEKSGAFRDLIVFGRYKNLAQSGMDTYALAAYGDRMSYTSGAQDETHMLKFKKIFEEQIRPISVNASAPARNSAKLDIFFSKTDIEAMDEIKQLALRDGAKISVLAHSFAATIWENPSQDLSFRRGRDQYFKSLAIRVGGSLIDPLLDLSIPDYGVMEETHLNTIGASIYTRALFDAEHQIAPKHALKSLPEVSEQASLLPIRLKESTFNSWSAILMLEANTTQQSLRCRFVESFAVPTLPMDELYFALRMPDGSDVVVPAKKQENGEYLADVDLKASAKKRILIFRLLHGNGDVKHALNAPLASYMWIQGS